MIKKLIDYLLFDKALTVRAAAMDDKTRLLEIFIRARSTAGCFRNSIVSQAEFDQITKGETIHIAEIGGQVAGFVSVRAFEGFIHHLYVCPSFQGQGVGKALLEMCERQYGLPLSLRCICTNERALDFYQRNGWITKGYGTGPEGPWAHLWRKYPSRA
ncbi:MAG: GNAT family N-acetyltransferase [Gammaproteobacteria bacterium]